MRLDEAIEVDRAECAGARPWRGDVVIAASLGQRTAFELNCLATPNHYSLARWNGASPYVREAARAELARRARLEADE
jgi:hypothetical protein